MADYQAICVFAGSSPRVADQFQVAARETGEAIAKADKTLVYGGSRRGLMGLCADGALAAGGRVVGVIPKGLKDLEVEHRGLSELHIVDDMHTRKQMMAELSDAFVVLPGGLGTLDETFEILTWKQLALHSKPIVVVNIDGYWDPMIAMIEHTIEAGFASKSHTSLYTAVTRVDQILDAIDSADSEPINPEAKWT